MIATGSINYHHSPLAEIQIDKKIVVSGAGPAGLSAAVKSLLMGNDVIILEAREKGYAARENAVLLDEDTVEILEEEEGIYSDLLAKGLVHSVDSNGDLSVRICDLEAALKEVIEKLGGVIEYSSKIKAIDDSGEKVALTLEDGRTIQNADVIINAEGASSTTNQILGNRRIEHLPKVPVIAALMKDGRKIDGVCSFFGAIFKTITYTAAAIYHYALLFFRWVFCCEGAKGAAVLQTPGQHYLGVLLSASKTEKLKQLLDAAKKGGSEEKARLDSFARTWAYSAFAQYNVRALAGKLLCRDTPALAGWRPIEKVQVVEIGCDVVEQALIEKKQSTFLMIGDALGTADPATGLGCNLAIQMAYSIVEYLEWGNNEGFIQDATFVKRTIKESSQAVRQQYAG